MGTRESTRTQWQNAGSIATVVAASIAAVSFVRVLVPGTWKPAATIASATLIVLIVVGYFATSRIRGAILKRSRFLKALAIAAVIPASHYFLIDNSYRGLLVSAIEALCILLMIQVSREWRTTRPVASTPDPNSILQWGGIELDVVGRGPQRDWPDGAPDACFILRLPPDDQAISEITLERLKPNGNPTREVWRASRHMVNWVLAVVVDGVRQTLNSQGKLHLVVQPGNEIRLYASDSWSPSEWFDRGQIYQVTVDYANKKDFAPLRVRIE